MARYEGAVTMSSNRQFLRCAAAAAALAIFSAVGFAQTPDCVQFFTFTSPTVAGSLPVPGATPVTDNRQTGCVNWIMVYESSGFSVVSLTFQSATGATVPGTLGPFSGTTVSGSNPATSTTSATTVFSGYVGWWNVALTATGAGTVRGSLYGYREGYSLSSSSGSGGCPGTTATPCVVDGPDAPGAASTKNPVQVAGNDGTDVRAIATDSSGRTVVVGAGVAGTPAGGIESVQGVSGGTNLPVSQPTASALNATVIGAGAAGTPNAGVETIQGIPGGTPVPVTATSGATCPTGTPCIVAGPTATGSAPTTNPVEVSGFDGTNVRAILTDANGRTINNPLGAATAQADGATNSPTVPEANSVATKVPVYAYHFNGATWDRQFYSTGQVQVNVSAATAQKLVAQSAGVTTRITHISFASNTPANVEITEGTTSSTPCDTSTVILAGPYENVTAIALDFGDISPLVDTAVNLDTCLIFSTTVTAGGVAKYAQF
jgi:hypothetical protein